MFICLLYVLDTGRKILKLGALPTINFPKKSVDTPKFPGRYQIIKTAAKCKKTHFPYKDFSDFTRQMFKREIWKRVANGHI